MKLSRNKLRKIITSKINLISESKNINDIHTIVNKKLSSNDLGQLSVGALDEFYPDRGKLYGEFPSGITKTGANAIAVQTGQQLSIRLKAIENESGIFLVDEVTSVLESV